LSIVRPRFFTTTGTTTGNRAGRRPLYAIVACSFQLLRVKVKPFSTDQRPTKNSFEIHIHIQSRNAIGYVTRAASHKHLEIIGIQMVIRLEDRSTEINNEKRKYKRTKNGPLWDTDNKSERIPTETHTLKPQ
jgi:hypothetical protein